jgi:thiol:disulfide interchange protein
MSPAPVTTWTSTIQTYFYLCLFLFAAFWIPTIITGQYLAGLLVGIVILYFAYRVIIVNGNLDLTPGITRPAVSFAIIFTVLLIIAVISFIYPPPPMIFPTQNDYIRHALIIGIPAVISIAGYFGIRSRT